MNGAIFYASKYGSTAEYARWIGEATGLPVFDVEEGVSLRGYDFVVLGSPIIYYKLLIDEWVRRNLAALEGRPVILFSVSGAGPSAKLDRWIAENLPGSLIDHMQHFALRGRQVPSELTLYDRIMLIIGGLKNPDRKAGREELRGFDFMDKASIGPVVAAVRGLLEAEAA